MRRGGAAPGMRFVLVLGTALTLSACVAGDRVTLLSHSDGGPVGSVAVLDEERGETVLDAVNQQARLSNRGARLRTLTQPDPAHADLIGSLPASASALSLTDFPTGRFSLSDAQKDAIRQHFTGLDDRPGYQIEIRGFTDSVGSEEINRTVSQGRADGVAEVLTEMGFAVDRADVIGMSEFEAARLNGDEMSDPSFRRVDVVIR